MAIYWLCVQLTHSVSIVKCSTAQCLMLQGTLRLSMHVSEVGSLLQADNQSMNQTEAIARGEVCFWFLTTEGPQSDSFKEECPLSSPI